MDLKLKIKKLDILKNYNANYIIGVIVFLALLNIKNYQEPIEKQSLYKIQRSDSNFAIGDVVPTNKNGIASFDIALKIKNSEIKKIVSNISRYKTTILWNDDIAILKYEDIKNIFNKPSNYIFKYLDIFKESDELIIYSLKK